MSVRRILITGTDTGVGKTHCAVWMAKQLQSQGLRVGLYKPVCSGANVVNGQPAWDDLERLFSALDGTVPRDLICPQRFLAPLAPPLAAALEGRAIDESLLIAGAKAWNDRVDVLLVEGAGGWLSPISSTWTNADLAERLGAEVVIVAANRLGVINHSLLTIEHVRRTCSLLGMLLNDVAPRSPNPDLPPDFDTGQSNLEEIERRSGTPVWGILSHGTAPVLHRDRQPIEWQRFDATRTTAR